MAVGDSVRDKVGLRAAVVAARDAMSDAARAEAAAAIAAHAAKALAGETTVAAYLSVGTEPATRTLIDGLVATGTTVLLPVIDGDDLDWAPYDGADALAAGPLGIVEPTTARLGAAAINGCPVILVPALAIDRTGNRLGRGRGYYDRALRAAGGRLIGVVYDAELLAAVPAEQHDRRVDAVLRPSGLIRTG